MKITNLAHNNESLNNFTNDVIRGLKSKPKFISSQHFYDDNGSNLFQKITKTKDYYLTLCEYRILEKTSNEIAQIMSKNKTGILDVIELGPGDGHKSRLIINALLTSNLTVNYYPIDISERALLLLSENLFSSTLLNTHAIIADYIDGITHINKQSSNPKLVLFLGSSIGNFDPKTSLDFLQTLKNNLNPDDFLLIGFDQKKEINILQRAYNDGDGLTREFNLNILRRINRELGANFVINNFEHHGFYNPNLGAMESYLISLCEQTVIINGLQEPIVFHKFEPLHLEYSYKYLLPEIELLSKATECNIIKNFNCDDDYYIISLWQVC